MQAKRNGIDQAWSTCSRAQRKLLLQRERWVKLKHDVSDIRGSVGAEDLYFYPSAGG